MPETFQPSSPQPLGRTEPKNFKHVQLFRLIPTLITKPTPVAIGVDWHAAFDRPVLRGGRWWLPDLAKGESLGSIRGGHCVCLRPDATTDLTSWWEFYDQGSEGACVGFGCSRMKTLMERARFDARWLYFEAQKVDFWQGGAYPGASPFYEGTSVSAAADVLRNQGHKTPKGSGPNLNFGIEANRWAQTLDEIRDCLRSPNHDRLEAVPLLNSWGRGGYPHITWLPYATLRELIENRGGEATIVTDR